MITIIYTFKQSVTEWNIKPAASQLWTFPIFAWEIISDVGLPGLQQE